MPKFFLNLFSVALLILCQASASRAGQIFLFIDRIPGDSGDPTHLGWHTVLSASWGSNAAPFGTTVNPAIPALTVTIHRGSSSALLAQESLAQFFGKRNKFKEVKLEVVEAMGSVLVPLSRLKLTGAQLTSYATSLNTNAGTSLGTESLSFSFDSITWIDFKIDNQGRQSPGSAACMDVIKGGPCTPTF